MIVQQAVGAGWYTLFGDAWMNSLGFVISDFDNVGSIQYGISMVLSLILTYGMARFWLALGTKDAARGAVQGVILWLTFIVSYQGVHTAFEQISDAAILDPANWIQAGIDTGMSLVVFVLNGAVLAGWRKE
ncbi:MAG: DUF1761 domain-containing protein [Proteobacteria bacterium]|nr:DUF1761 domain-containing protein [Pseudomonadota bacterium]